MRKTSFLYLAAALLLGLSQSARAIIDATLQMQLGNPSFATADTNNHDHFLIQRPVEAIDYSDNLREPNWASWDLTASDVGSSGRSPDFYEDTNLPANFYRVLPTDLSGSGYDRGHMCPSADRTDTVADNEMVFFMSNIIPQAPDNNQGVWANFEDYCRGLTSGNEILITCGPGLFDGSRTGSAGAVAIPTYTWKIAVVVPLGSGAALSRITSATRVIAIRVPNTNGVSSAWQNYVTSVNQIQVDTGLAFFTALPSDVAAALRSKVDGQAGPPPGIASVAPFTGAAGDQITITGTNFTSASAVAFNGVSAAFTINSATQITATVPTFASTGKISVTTPNGTGLSASSFTVTGAFLDLAIGVSHNGHFIQGDAGYLYTIIVTNSGTVASSGTVTVSDLLPAGLTATAMSGPGWTANLTSLTCTRTDGLPPGAAYPAITVTVTAGSSGVVTNVATFSGGGDTNAVNNTTSDLTVIDPPGGGGGTNVISLVGWDVHGVGSFGVSPLPPTTNAANLTVVGLTRGPGVATTGTGAGGAWGGDAFNSSSAVAAIAAGQYATFSLTANAGYRVSYSLLDKFDYRRSNTGPNAGVLQYQLDNGQFNDIAPLSYSVAGTGTSLNAIDLSGIADLQNVAPGVKVTFRIVNYGGSSAAGTWYVYDAANTTALDFEMQGVVALANPPVADLGLAVSHSGSVAQADSGDAYGIVVTNAGIAPSVGPVTVTLAVPSGLTVTAIGGAGWTPNLGALTCTRSDSLPVASAYPLITVTFDVAANAPSVVTNFATVSGGGETNTANDTAGDMMAITPLTPVQRWRLQWFGATVNTGESSDLAVSSSDGMPNLLKYALGLDPLAPAADPVVADTNSGYLRLTLPKNPDATDISFHVEATADLSQSWSTNATTIDQETSTLLQVQYNTPLTNGLGFLRLRVSRP
ncbi:MAG TPA: DNA/RNA non-specific endonuclease [Verrucomicrobiae bacterium]|jgi:endonuclease G|nr:DNA/RNA non-specific endonuclease [Verrucomicrobiae bacterium]